MRVFSFLAAVAAFYVVAALELKTKEGFTVIMNEDIDGESITEAILIECKVEHSSLRNSYIVNSELNDNILFDCEVSDSFGSFNEFDTCAVQVSFFESSLFENCAVQSGAIDESLFTASLVSGMSGTGCTFTERSIIQGCSLFSVTAALVDITSTSMDEATVVDSYVSDSSLVSFVASNNEYLESELNGYEVQCLDGVEFTYFDLNGHIYQIPSSPVSADASAPFNAQEASQNATIMDFPASNTTQPKMKSEEDNIDKISSLNATADGGNGTEPGTFTIETVANPSPTTPPASDAADDANVVSRRDKVNRRVPPAMPNRIYRAKNRK